MGLFSLFAFSAGAAIAIQALMNAKLSVLLKNTMMATSIAFLVSFIFAMLAMAVFSKHYPTISEIKSVPTYLWFTGGILSAFGVGVFYFLIPKMGVSSMVSFALSGQILVAMTASHFGWFELPIKTINMEKFIGAILLIAGVLLVNWEKSNAC